MAGLNRRSAPAGAHERAARPEAGDEMREPAAGLLDDLGAGASKCARQFASLLY